ncbi:AraC-type DNA-binding protein [Andreprevotia lacus DSM 23236]|uniref:AraC-type DNA-binding protein n=1 Tax=Andreprevotia lacus DSM 23236 TaxID=1121001 RepID=A0A1W1WY21_9NEIS|nr:helix-turn-helix transcriptional regulator [Andreprevotia lacus]SMC16493.1 AraC-type DNA-binding protein [Andreprevotia lacus DSM 23236]
MLDKPPRYLSYHHSSEAVVAMAQDYLPEHETPWHQHPHAQLIHAVQGVMLVTTSAGRWVVPPSRALWMPAGTQHHVRMVGHVQMRTLFIRPDAAPDLPQQCAVLAVSALMRELIVAATTLEPPYPANSRASRLSRLLLDEILLLPTLPLHLPQPADPQLQAICAQLASAPDETATVADWAAQLGVDARTLQRRFNRATGMSFGQWRQQARLLLALEKLACGMKIVDVALDCGYDSPSAFTAMFRRHFGVAPSAFFR